MTTTTDKQAKRRARHIAIGIEEYHLLPEWSRSQLETLWGSPPLFHGRHITHEFPFKRTTAMDTGTVAHQALTSPGGLSDVVSVIPCDVLNGDGHRKGKAWLTWKADHPDRIHMTEAEVAGVRAMIRNVYAHDEAGPLFALAIHYEHTILYHDAESGLDLRARPDVIAGRTGKAVIFEYKTTRAVTPQQFMWDAYDMGYHRQQAWYWDAVEAWGLEVEDFIFVTSDKTPAYQCRCYRLPKSALKLGRDQNRQNRSDLARRLEKGDWSDPLGSGIHEIDLPEKAYPAPSLTMGGVAVQM